MRVKKILSIVLTTCLLMSSMCSIPVNAVIEGLSGFTYDETTGGTATDGVSAAQVATVTEETGKLTISVPAKLTTNSRLWHYTKKDIVAAYAYDVEFTLNVKAMSYATSNIEIQVGSYSKSSKLSIYLGGGKHDLTFNGVSVPNASIELNKPHVYRITGSTGWASLYVDGVLLAENTTPAGGAFNPPCFKMILNNGSDTYPEVQTVELTSFAAYRATETTARNEEIAEIVAAFNGAADWQAVKTLITETYSGKLYISDAELTEAATLAQEGLYNRLVGQTYTYPGDVAVKFRAAIEAQKEAGDQTDGDDSNDDNTQVDTTNLVSDINTASADGDWEELKTLISVTYADALELTDEELQTANKVTHQELYERLTNKTFGTIADIATEFRTALTAQKTADAWVDKFAATGNYVKYEDGEIVIDIPAKAETGNTTVTNSIKIQDPIKRNQYDFDMEWDMALQTAQADAGALIEFQVVNYRYYLDIRSDKVNYLRNASQGDWGSLPYDIGTASHKWRLVGRSTTGYLYIDGNYVGSMTPHTSSVDYQLTLSINNGARAQKVVLSSFKGTHPVDKSSSINFNLNVGQPENDSLAISGNVGIPPFVSDASYDTNNTAYLVAYNNEYGYVTKVIEKNYTIQKGLPTDLTHTFDITGVDLATNKLGLMFIGISGKSLADAWGYTPENEAVASTQTPGLAVTANYNSVNVFGYTGDTIIQPVTVLIKSGGVVKAVAQTNTNINGMIDVNVGIDPETNNGGSYDVIVQYGSNPATTTTKTLVCKNDLAGYSADTKEDFKEFIDAFGTSEEKATLSNAQDLERAYNTYIELVGSGDKNDFFSLTLLAKEAIMGIVYERTLVEEMNVAAANDDWEEIKNIIMTKYAGFLKLTDSDIQKATKVVHQELFLRMTGRTYTSPEEILAVFRSAVEEELPKHSWLDGFEQSITGAQASSASILKEDGKLKLIVPQRLGGAGSTNVQLTKNLQLPGNQFDIEWTMTIKEQNAGSSVLVLLYTGAKRYQIGVYATMPGQELMYYGRAEGATQSAWNPFESLEEGVDHILLNTPTTFRMVGNNTLCYFYVNGKFMQTVKPAASETGDAHIELSVDNSNKVDIESFTSTQPVDTSKTTVTDMTVSGPENDKLNIEGTVIVKPFAESWETAATAYAVAYNNENGYVSYADKKDYSISKGVNDLTHEFSLGGLDTTANTMGVILVGESGKAVDNAWGYMPENVSKGAPVSGQVAGMTATTRYNEVNITGFAGYQAEVPVVIIIEDGSGSLKAAAQVTTNENGMLDTTIGIDPYTNSSGGYTLKLQYGNNPQETQQIQLACGSNYFDGHTITDENSFKAFVTNFGTDEEKAALEDSALLTAAYNRYVTLLGDGVADDFFDFSKKVSQAIKTEVDEKTLVSDMNTAAANERWSIIKTLVTETYADHIGVTEEDIQNANGVSSEKDLYMRMTKTTYTDSAGILSAFRTAITDQIEADSITPPAGGTTGGITGGGSPGSKFDSKVEVEDKPVEDTTVDTTNGDPGAFKDIENISWAKESIEKLRLLGVISGDGNGYFYPNKSISREEFLKLVISALDVKAESGNTPEFADIDENAWYYDYIETAYQCGIVNGMSDTKFGIGMEITRADMATMLMRALNYKGIELKYIKNAIVFDDVYDIPVYARDSVNNLYRAGLLNGTAEGVYTPSADTTRAQAAVAIYRIFDYVAQ